MGWSKNTIRVLFGAIFVIGALAALLDFSAIPGVNIPFRLGLDLQGGTQLIYEADKQKIQDIPSLERVDALGGVRDVIERRVNTFGVSEPVVQTSQSGESLRIIVELAGVHDVNSAIAMIGETPILEFKEESTTTPKLTEEEQKKIDLENAEIKTRALGILQKTLEPDSDFTALAKEFSEEPNAKETGGDLGWQKRGAFVPEFEDACFNQLKDNQISQELTETMFGYHIIKKLGEREISSQPIVAQKSTSTQSLEPSDEKEYHCQHILIRTKNIYDVRPELTFGNWKDTPLSGEQLKSAQVIFQPNTGFVQVSLQFNKEGEKLFEEITKRNVGRQVAIFLDGQPISIPQVQTVISGGSAIITGNFSLEEAKLLAQRLNAGALRVPIHLISQQTIGPTLGALYIQKSFNAGIIGLILIIIFMIGYYRFPGILAAIALLVYGSVVLALFKLIPVTLTLSGIAGFILSIGMAVDANVLIFERMKEELLEKNTLGIAIDRSFTRAWSSIRDGNISTLITCLVLIGFSSSVVRGFAVTLAIGILVSMFSAMIITKVFLKITQSKNAEKFLWLYGIHKKGNP